MSLAERLGFETLLGNNIKEINKEEFPMRNRQQIMPLHKIKSKK